MEATKNCPECGRTLDMHSPEGHCPRTEYSFGDWLLSEHKAAERKDASRRWMVWFHEDGFDDAWLATFADRDDALNWGEQQQDQTKRKGCIYYVRKEGE